MTQQPALSVTAQDMDGWMDGARGWSDTIIASSSSRKEGAGQRGRKEGTAET